MSITVPLAVLLSAAVTAFFELAVHRRWQKQWIQRGFTASAFTGRLPTAARWAAAISVGTAAAAVGSLPASAAAAAGAWFCALALSTDLVDVKIPKEPTWFVAGTGLAAAAFSSSWVPLILAGTTLVLILLLLGLTALLTKGGLGSGDVRLMVSLTPLSAWFGVTTFLWALLIACALQLPLRFFVFKKQYPGRTGYPFAPALVAGLTIAIVLAVLDDSYTQGTGLLPPF